MRNAHNVHVRLPGGEMSFGGPRPKWENNIKMNFKEAFYSIE
jgi:hypothetical protein